MLQSDTVSKGEAQASPLLLAFADKGIKEAFANIFRNANTIINDLDDHALLFRLQGYGDGCDRSCWANRRAGVEQQIVDRSFDLPAVDEGRSQGRLAAAHDKLDAD